MLQVVFRRTLFSCRSSLPFMWQISGKLSSFLSLKYQEIVFYVLIESMLSYDIIIFGDFYDCVLENLNATQRRILKIITKRPREKSQNYYILKAQHKTTLCTKQQLIFTMISGYK